MQINVTGLLLYPTGGVIPNQVIRVTTKLNGDTLSDTAVQHSTDANGLYDFILLEGTYYIEILVSEEYQLIGDVTVNDATPSLLNLPSLIKYSTPVDVSGNVTYPPAWQALFDALDNGTFTKARSIREQIVDELAHVTDLKEVETNGDLDARSAADYKSLETCGAKAHTEHKVYSNGSGKHLASTTRIVETPNGSSIDSKLNDDISTKDTSLSTFRDTTYESARTLTDGHSNFTESTETTGVSETEVKSHNATGTTKTKTTTLTNTSVTESSNIAAQGIIEQVLDVLVGNGISLSDVASYLRISPTEVDKTFSADVAGKVTSDKHTNDGGHTEKSIVVDNYNIGNGVNKTLEVDTATETVYVRGKMWIEELQDSAGNPIIPEDGETIFQVFQYADNPNGPWSNTLESYHSWKRENFSVNGVIDPLDWSIAYQFKGIDGAPGDTIFEEYQYSPDGVTNWSSELKAGDKYRRSRKVTNGVAGSWSTPAQIVGNDGPSGNTVELRHEFSIDGVFLWHSPMENGDVWQRSAVFVNSVQTEPWSDPVRVRGNDGSIGEDGDTIYEQHRYGVTSNVSDGTWTAWGGTQLDTHFWRQTRTITNGSAGAAGVVHRIVGKPGSGWYTLIGNNGVWPGNATATANFISAFGRTPTLDDHLTYVDKLPNSNASETRRCNSPEGSTVTWGTPTLALKGDFIVRGTISGDRLVANTITGNQISSATTIIAGSGSWTAGMNGNDAVSAGVYRYWRFWAGATSPSSAPFKVDRDGRVTASKLTLSSTAGESSININNLFTVASDGTTSIKSSTTGSRLVINGDRLEVYDGTALRVRLGRL